MSGFWVFVFIVTILNAWGLVFTIITFPFYIIRSINGRSPSSRSSNSSSSFDDDDDYNHDSNARITTPLDEVVEAYEYYCITGIDEYDWFD